MAFDPSAMEQELMQLTNRFRTDPQHEFSRVMVSASPRKARDANVDFSLSYFNTNATIVQAELAALPPVPPVAWDAKAYQMAKDYLPFMISAKSSSHTLNGDYQPRVMRYGFDFSQGGTAEENLFTNAFSPIHAHASYVMEWGSGANGLQGRGHRNNLMSPSVKQAGMAFAPATYEPASAFGPYVNAEELIGLGVTGPIITGAIFQDRNGSGWYDAGEGLSGVQFTFDGPAGHFATSGMSAGGYSMAVPAGTYTVVASGGGMRFPITKTGVVVGSQNVWLNFIYDPSAVPPDAREANNTPSTATVLSGGSQTLGDGTIHSGDIDYFRFPAATDGPLRVELRFANSAGNLNLRVLAADGRELARSSSTSDLESLTVSVTHGQIYYIVVEGASGGVGGGTGGPYTLQLFAPTAQAPLARPDWATTSLDQGTIAIDVLANDRDPDGNLSQATVAIASSGRGTATVTADHKIRYTPPPSFTGVDTLTYALTDQQGLASAPVSVSVMVLDFHRQRPFLNPVRPADVNGDGAISPVDALLVINAINARGPGALPSSAGGVSDLFGFVDTNGNGTLEAFDVLLVVNQLNSGSGEGEAAPLDELRKRRGGAFD